MILTLNKQRFADKEEGKDLPMFSRSGKSTNSHYLVFKQPARRGVPDDSEAKEAEEDLEVRKAIVAREFEKIRERKK